MCKLGTAHILLMKITKNYIKNYIGRKNAQNSTYQIQWENVDIYLTLVPNKIYTYSCIMCRKAVSCDFRR